MPHHRLVVCALIATVSASAAGADDTSVGYPRYPALSPDGSTLVFSWAGDLWAADAAGGRAARLTSHPAMESRSAFSPDGSTLAFNSNRDGPTTLYVVELTGEGALTVAGHPRLVTKSDTSRSLSAWTPEGDALLCWQRDPTIYRDTRMYRVPLDGGPATRITDAFGRAPRMSAGGETMVFGRGRYGPERPIYRGEGDHDVWIMDLRQQDPAKQFRQLTMFDGTDADAWIVPGGDVILTSSRDGQNNVYRLRGGADDTNIGALTQLTNFKPGGDYPGGEYHDHTTIAHGVRDLAVSADGSTAAFCVWDSVYTLDLTNPNAKAQRLELVASGDDDEADVERENLRTSATEAALSPDGGTMAIVTRGEVYVRSTEDGREARRVTNSYARESDLAWSPDGQFLYFASNADGRADIHRAAVTLTLSDIRPEADESKDDAKGDEGDTPAGDAPADPISGEWNGTLILGDQTIPFTLRLDLGRDGDVSGEFFIPIPDNPFTAPIEHGRFDAGSGDLTFEVETPEGRAVAEFTVTDNEMTGSLSSGERSARIEASRPAGDGASGDEDADDEEEADKRETGKGDKKDKIDHGKRWQGALRFNVEPYIATPEHEFAPTPSPDGRKLLYHRSRGDIVIRDLVSGNETVLMEWWDDPDISWARDSRHVVYAVADLDFNSDVYIRDTHPGEDGNLPDPINISMHPDNDLNPALSDDGKVLVFQSERAGENWQYDLYRVYLDERLDGLLGYELDEYFDDAAAAAKKARKPLDAIDWSADDPFEDRETADPIDLSDARNAYLRVARLAPSSSSQSIAGIAPGGDRFLYVESGSLRSEKTTGGDEKTIQSGAGDVRVALDGTITYVSGGQAGSASITGGSKETYSINAPVIIEIAEQQRQKFRDAATSFGDFFYHPTLKGLDWPAIMNDYEKLAVKTRNSSEFNDVVSDLFGEVNGSHVGIWGGGGWGTSGTSVGSLGIDAEPVVEGDVAGYRVTRLIDGGPAARETSRLEVGDVITAVEDRPLASDGTESGLIDLDEALAGTVGRETLIEVYRALDAGEEAEDRDPHMMMIIEPISSGAESQLRYEDEVQRRRAFVEEVSDGRVGYLHIRAMSMPSVRDFERDLYAAGHGKESLIIDVRDNGGGSTTDILLSSLTAPAHAYTVPRGTDPDLVRTDHYPRDRRLIYAWTKPIAVLCNANSFSNAEIFSHAIKTIGRGPVIGQTTYGGVISTGSMQLIDGTTIRRPFRGWYLPDGTDMENHGAEPDVKVPQNPGDEAAGEDPQLRAAVEEALRELDQ